MLDIVSVKDDVGRRTAVTIAVFGCPSLSYKMNAAVLLKHFMLMFYQIANFNAVMLSHFTFLIFGSAGGTRTRKV